MLESARDSSEAATIQAAPGSSNRPGASQKSLRTPAFSDSKRDRYEVRRELGAGGMAVVYDAVDNELRRHVAVKVLHDSHHMRDESDSDGRSPIQRFIEEAQITGQLEHPNIVPVHEIGEDHNGRLFFTMKRVEGRSLGEVLDSIRAGNEADLDEFDAFRICEILLKVCNALEFAHSRDVIHRDLKPDNIMIGRFGEVQVMDWGLAKLLRPGSAASSSAIQTYSGIVSTHSGDATETLDGTISGTPAYMAPEQARGETANIDKRSDVFLVGALIYEAITLVPPFHADSSLSALRRAQNHDLPEPRIAIEELERNGALPDGEKVHPRAIARVKRLPRDLAAIAMKALQERPADRYQSISDLARDIERYLKGERVSVYQEPLCKTVARWISRHQVSVAVAISILLVGLAAHSVISSLKTSNAELESQKKAQELSAAKQKADDELQQRMQLQLQRALMEKRDRAKSLLGASSTLLWRGTPMQDAEARQQTLLKALQLADDATRVDPDFGPAYTLKGNILFDLGRMDEALRTLLEGIRIDEAGGFTLNAENFMTPAMIMITQAVLYDIDGSVWSPGFIELMDRASAIESAPAEYRELCRTLSANVKTYCEFQRAPVDSELRALALRRLHDIANDVTRIRLSRETAGRERFWEVYLFSAWHVTEGWGDFPSKEGENILQHHLRRMERGIELANRALELRPTLPLAVMLKSYVTFEKSKLTSLLNSGKGASVHLTSTAVHEHLSTISTENLVREAQTIRAEYLKTYPYDTTVMLDVARSLSGCNLDACPVGKHSTLEIYEFVVQSVTPSPYIRASYARELETHGEFASAALQHQRNLDVWLPGEERVPEGGRQTFSGYEDNIWLSPTMEALAFYIRRTPEDVSDFEATLDQLLKGAASIENAELTEYIWIATLEQLLMQSPNAKVFALVDARFPKEPTPRVSLRWARLQLGWGEPSAKVEQALQNLEAQSHISEDVTALRRVMRQLRAAPSNDDLPFTRLMRLRRAGGEVEFNTWYDAVAQASDFATVQEMAAVLSGACGEYLSQHPNPEDVPANLRLRLVSVFSALHMREPRLARTVRENCPIITLEAQVVARLPDTTRQDLFDQAAKASR